MTSSGWQQLHHLVVVVIGDVDDAAAVHRYAVTPRPGFNADITAWVTNLVTAQTLFETEGDDGFE